MTVQLASQMDQKIKLVLEGCIDKNRKSQKTLYEMFYAYAMSIAIRYIKDQQLAEVAVNEGFLKVFNNLGKFDLNRPIKPWLRQIVVNTSLDHLKKKNKLKVNTDITEATQLADRENILSNISYQELIALVHSLSDAYRTIFNMYVIDGFKHEEIAKKLGISVGTSKSNLSKARGKLRTMISNQLIMQENG
jgi:RNA polymerase sigma-70 factor (ECF subfamily)